MTALKALQDRVGFLEGEKQRDSIKIRELQREISMSKQSLSSKEKNADINYKVKLESVSEMPRNDTKTSNLFNNPKFPSHKTSETENFIFNEKSEFETKNFDNLEKDFKEEFAKYSDSLNNNLGLDKSLTKKMPTQKLSKVSTASNQTKEAKLPNKEMKTRLIQRIVGETIDEKSVKSTAKQTDKRAVKKTNSAHTRIKGQIEIPNNTGNVGSDGTKRAMPFIVGKVCFIKRMPGNLSQLLLICKRYIRCSRPIILTYAQFVAKRAAIQFRTVATIRVFEI